MKKSYSYSTTMVPVENSSILKVLTCGWCNYFLLWKFTLGHLFKDAHKWQATGWGRSLTNDNLSIDIAKALCTWHHIQKAKSGTAVILKVNTLKYVSRRSVKCLVLTNSWKKATHADWHSQIKEHMIWQNKTKLQLILNKTVSEYGRIVYYIT